MYALSGILKNKPYNLKYIPCIKLIQFLGFSYEKKKKAPNNFKTRSGDPKSSLR